MVSLTTERPYSESHRGRVAVGQPRVEVQLLGLQMFLDQTRDRLAGQCTGVEVCEGVSPPKLERLGEQLHPLGGSRRLGGAEDQGAEQLEVDLFRIRVECVAAVAGANHRPVDVAQGGPKPGDVDLQCCARVAGQLVVVPEHFDEIARTHGPGQAQQQRGKQHRRPV
jgi:hypothetical protein